MQTTRPCLYPIPGERTRECTLADGHSGPCTVAASRLRLTANKAQATAYTLEAGRCIVFGGVRIAQILGVRNEQGYGYTIGSPAELDEFTHHIVAALNLIQQAEALADAQGGE